MARKNKSETITIPAPLVELSPEAQVSYARYWQALGSAGDLMEGQFEDPSDIESNLRWKKAKFLGKIGFAIGISLGLFTMILNGTKDLCNESLISVGVGLIGMLGGIAIGTASHAYGRHHQFRSQVVHIFIVATWSLGCVAMQFRSNGRIHVSDLVIALGSGLLATMFLGVLANGFLMLWDIIHKNRLK